MAKKSAMLSNLDAYYKNKYEQLFLKKMRMVGQIGQDAGMMAAKDVFGMGQKRALDFAVAYREYFNEICRMIKDDTVGDDEFWETKEKVDRKLKQICGESFDPWEVRYQDE